MKIKINDKEYGLHWGMGALRLFCDSTDYAFENGLGVVVGTVDVPALERSKAVATMVLCAITNYANLHDEDVSEVTFYKVEAYRDEVSPEQWQKVMQDFMNSLFFGKTVWEMYGLEPPKEDSQKKSPKASTKKS